MECEKEVLLVSDTYKQIRNIMKSINYLNILDNIEQKLKTSRSLDDVESKQLIDILEFCNIHSKIDLANKLLNKPQVALTREELNKLLQLTQECKLALESFVDYHSHSDFVLSIVSSEER